MGNITTADLEAALSSTSYRAIFSDNNEGSTNPDVAEAIIARASAMADSWVASVYEGPFPLTVSPIPGMVKELTLQYALALSYERRPDYTRTLEGSAANDEERWRRADALGERLKKAVQRIIELPVPKNEGAEVSNVTAESATATTAKTFDDMGDF